VFNQEEAEAEDRSVATNAQVVRQGFSNEELAMQNETAANALAAAAKATIEARYILAMKRPRDWDTVRTKLLKACDRPAFADEAIYRKPVGKKKNDQGEWEQAYVEGPSVRFAEEAKRCMGNLYWSSTSIYDDPAKSIVRVTVMDLESNDTGEIDVTVEKTVERRSLKRGQTPLRRRVNSYGEEVFVVSATDDEVLNKLNALVSKAFRNGLMRMLPGDIASEGEDRCRATQKKRDAADPDAAKRKLFDSFASIGIMPDAIKAYLGHAAEVLHPKELTELRAIFAAIRDGETSWGELMEAKSPSAASANAEGGAGQKPGNQAAVDDLVRKQKEKADARKAAAAAKAAPPEPSAATDAPKANPEDEREPGAD
jgi:hypothetical protein